VKPLAISAIAPPTGSDWGGEKVNAQFRDFLQELLGPDLLTSMASCWRSTRSTPRST
jgi:hypothetical protein